MYNRIEIVHKAFREKGALTQESISMYFYAEDGSVERIPVFRLGEGRPESGGFKYPLQFVYGNRRERVKEFHSPGALASAPLMTTERDDLLSQQAMLGWQESGAPREKNEHLGWGNFDYEIVISLVPTQGAGQKNAMPPKAFIDQFTKQRI